MSGYVSPLFIPLGIGAPGKAGRGFSPLPFAIGVPFPERLGFRSPIPVLHLGLVEPSIPVEPTVPSPRQGGGTDLRRRRYEAKRLYYERHRIFREDEELLRLAAEIVTSGILDGDK